MMGITTLRSLLLAAFVLSNISRTTSRHQFRHNAHGTRHRRQDAGLYHPASYVIPGGKGTGAWGEWGRVSPCSRTCGGGVAYQKRICLQVGPDDQPLCTGGDTKYFSCQTQDCPEDAGDFRAEQCAEYNNQPYLGSGIKYNWVPYTKGPHPCELNCMPRGERFYYQMKSQVVDGTRCDDVSFNVCVAGVCQPVGCDMMLGSNAREDQCRVCRGNGTNCNTVEGLLDADDLTLGYNDILLIPQGATNIFIEEVRASNNYLALRSKTQDVYYLNGKYEIDSPKSFTINETLWHYERSYQGIAAPDKLKCIGPTSEPLYLSLLLQDYNVGVSYKYSVPSASAPPLNQQYAWVHTSFSECSATCGGGFQVREVKCRSREELDTVSDTLCDDGLKPSTNQTCNIEDCPPRWVEGPWSPCSRPCGDDGKRSRQVYCEKIITNRETFRFPSIVADEECFDLLGPKPKLEETCNQNATCPTWFTGPWKPCNRLCGEGKQTRQVVCHQRIDGFVQLFEDRDCDGEKPITSKACLLHPCDGVDWVISEWSGCDTCLSTVRTRVAHCATKDHQVIDPNLCSYHPSPVLKEECDRTKLPPCQVQWYATQWSNCSVECGTGVRTRRVFCGLFDGASVIKVDDERCDAEYKYNDTTECVIPEENCPAKWFAGPWSECTKKCGGGEQYRRVMCLFDKEFLECNNGTVLHSTQSCNIGPCDKDDLLPIDSKSVPVFDDYEEEDCVEEEEEYPEVGAEEYATFEAPLFADFLYEGPTTASTTEISEETGSGYEWIEYNETSTTDVTESTDISSSYSTVESTTEQDVTISTESKESADSISTEIKESTTIDGITFSVTEVSDSATENEDLSSENTTLSTSEISISSTTENINSISTEIIESSTTDGTSSSIMEITEPTTETTENSESSTKENAASSTTDSAITSTSESTETISTKIIESSTTDSISSSITKVTDSTTENEEFDTTESESSMSENVSSTTTIVSSESSTTDSDISSTIETSSSSITDGSSSTEITETPVSGTTENDKSTTITESTDSSTVYSTQESSEFSTIKITESSITDKDELSTTASDFYTTTENGESSTTEKDTSSTTNATPSTSESTISSTAENTASSTTENTVSTTSEGDIFSTTETVLLSTTDNGASITTENFNLDILTSEGSTDSTKAESTTSYSTESSTTQSDGTGTTGSTETTETGESSTSPGITDSTTSESSTIYSTESSTTESDGTGTTGSTETTETGESSTSPGITDSITSESSTIYSTESSTTESDGSGTSISTETTETGESSTSPGITDSTTSESSAIYSTESSTTESDGTGTSGSTETTETGESSTSPGITDITTSESSTIYSTESSTTESEGTGTTGSTETTGTEESSTSPVGATDASTSSEESLTNESSVIETSITDSTISESSTIYSTESSTTESDGTGTTGSTETTETGESSTSPGTTDASTSSDESLSNESSVTETTPWDWASTVEVLTNKPRCKPRKTAKCTKSKFGCCPDKRTPAAGPFDEGCPNPETCKDSKFGCCPDGVSPAAGPLGRGCPVSPCNETLYGCCSDNVTASEGNNYEGCPPLQPACKYSKYGCCDDNDTYAKGFENQGCPETGISRESTETPTPVVDEGCATAEFGCCFDNETNASGPNGEGCPCSISEFGCCPDGLTTASGYQMEGCLMSCNTSAYGCCPDGETPAHGPQSEGCCLLYEFGCCPDNYRPAKGPANEGCGCEYARFGCCPDKITIARGPNMEGCGCEHSQYGCCPDRHTEAQGTEFKGCECHTHQFGCCLDGVTIASGPALEGCRCKRSKYGCCGDETTAAKGPDMAGCDCSNSKYGCCPDGKTEAGGDNFQNCSNVPINKQAACALDSDKGPCRNYTKFWYYDMQYGGCSQFWYGGCEGNGNRFVNKAECEDVCVRPSPKDSCNLPKVKAICGGYHVRWYYNSERKQCSQFVYSGCLGNDNNFDTKEICQERCEPEKTEDKCNLALERGPCAGNFARWGFSAERRRCEQFVWGGCGGNQNRYDSEAACQLQCAPHGKPQQACSLPQDAGNCTEKHPVWSFNQTENRCVPFYYSGCGGNDNRFYTEHSCDDSCPSAYVQEICTLPAMIGDCEVYKQKWFYDTTIKRCRQFYYGGCGGNENNFFSESECENRCSEQLTTTTTTTTTITVKPEPLQPQTESAVISEKYDVCQLPFVSGPCDQSIMQWFYNTASKSCNQFVYGGCEGNGNRFDTQEECERQCKQEVTTTFIPMTLTTTPTIIEEAECAPPLSLEPCGENATVYYFDTRTQACLVGNFGTCRYSNSYRTEEECQRRCGAFRYIDVCGYPLDTGPCRDAIPKFYWEPISGRCLRFAYGGCHGGPNRFSTEDECEEICGANRPESRCLELVSSGTPGCGIPSRRWYYSAVSGECVAFVYSGCGGNDNNFHTYKECALCKRLPPPISETDLSNEVLPDCDANNAECEALKCNYGVQRTRSSNSSCERCKCKDHPCANKICSSGERCVVITYRDPITLDVIYSTDCGIVNKSGLCPSNAESVSSIESGCRFECNDDADCSGSGKCCQRDCSKLCLEPAVATSPAPTITTYAPEMRQVPSVNSATEPDVHASLGGTATLRCLFHGNPPPKITWQRGQITIDGDVGRYRLLSDGALEIVSVFRNDSGVYICIADNGFGVARQEVNLQVDEMETGNEVLPDCDANNAECAALNCDYGVQRTRSSNSGCERCKCKDHPCANKICSSGERCVVITYRDPITLDVIYSPDCGIVNKSGLCPSNVESVSSIESGCGFECNDDADCPGTGKCCERDCSKLCLEPALATSPAPTITTYAPELPQVPSVNSATEPDVHASLGGTATLRCLFHGNPPPKITWQRGQITIDGDVGRYRLLSDGALEIVSVFRNDSGVYICIADNGFGVARQEVNLQVDEIETGNEVLPDCDFDNAECTALQCEYGMQRSRASSGCERCKCNDHPCENRICSSGERCVVIPYRDPITLDVIYSSDCGIVNKSGLCPSNVESVSLIESGCRHQCNDDADCPGTGKCCERDCSKLCLEPVVATSPAPTITTYAPDLKQVPSANIATEPELRASLGGKATLRCLFHGNPPPKITWQRRHLTIEGDVGRYRLLSDGALEIVSVFRNDSGVYICIADNGLGVARQEVNLHVDNGVEGPAGIAGLSDAVVVGELGQPLSVRCMAYGYPPPSINWYHGRKGPMVPFSNVQYEARDNVLHIKKLSIDTLGEYVCLTYNGFGKPVDWSITVKAYRIDDIDNSLFLVTRQNEVVTTPRQPQTEATTTISPEIEIPVYTVPVTTRIVTENTRLAAGSELSLRCEVDGYPIPDVYWTKDSVEISSDDRITVTEFRLTVSGTNINDTGVYGCHAFNGFNSHYSSVQINIDGLYIPPTCNDNPLFANCYLIVRSKFCVHKYYSNFCCKSCVEAGQLDVRNLQLQPDNTLYRK